MRGIFLMSKELIACPMYCISPAVSHPSWPGGADFEFPGIVYSDSFAKPCRSHSLFHPQKVTHKVRLDFKQARVAILPGIGKVDQKPLEDRGRPSADDQDLL